MEKLINVYDIGCDGSKSIYLRSVLIPEEHIEKVDNYNRVLLTDYGNTILRKKLKGYRHGFLCLHFTKDEEKKKLLKELPLEIKRLQDNLDELLK